MPPIIDKTQAEVVITCECCKTIENPGEMLEIESIIILQATYLNLRQVRKQR